MENFHMEWKLPNQKFPNEKNQMEKSQIEVPKLQIPKWKNPKWKNENFPNENGKFPPKCDTFPNEKHSQMRNKWKHSRIFPNEKHSQIIICQIKKIAKVKIPI